MAADLTERVLGLTAYMAKRSEGCTLKDIARDVPGYEADGELVKDTPEWEAIRKRVRRDFASLEAGFGITAEYDEEASLYRLRPPFFDSDERYALIAATAAVDVAGIDEEPVLGELGAAVDEREQRIVLSVPARVEEFAAAIRTRCPVTFRYQGETRTLDGYAVGRWKTHWYVLGRDHSSDELRKFRIDRIDDGAAVIDVDTSAPPYEIPPEFKAVDEMRLDPNDWGSDPLVRARVRVTNDQVQNVQHEFGGKVVERGDAVQVVEFDVRHYVSFRDRLLAFRGAAVVSEPPELVSFVRDHLAAIVAAED